MICNKNEESARIAADFLKCGKICVLPTDTVYGFSGIAENSLQEKFGTDEKIRKIKGREEKKPFIQLVSSPDEISKYSDFKIPEQLAQKWPGALTVIVPLKFPFSEKNATVAFRCPGDLWLRNVIAECGFPIYSTSVNRSGSPVLDSVCKIEKEFSNEVDLIVDDGDKKGSLPSTIVLLKNGGWKVLRQGSVIV